MHDIFLLSILIWKFFNISFFLSLRPTWLSIKPFEIISRNKINSFTKLGVGRIKRRLLKKKSTRVYNMHVHSLERKSVLAYLKTVRYTFYDLMPCFLISQVFGNLSVHIEVTYWARIRVYMGHRIPLSECSLNLHDWNLKTNLSSLISWRRKIKTTGMTKIQYYVTSWRTISGLNTSTYEPE